MAAEDNLNPQQFYHGTFHTFSPGDVVDPSEPHAANHELSAPGTAYFSSDVSSASFWARRAVTHSAPDASPRVYQVEPLGEFGHDGSVRRGYATKHPLRVVGETGLYDYTRQGEHIPLLGSESPQSKD